MSNNSQARKIPTLGATLTAGLTLLSTTAFAEGVNAFEERLCNAQYNTGTLTGNWKRSFDHHSKVEDDHRAGRGLAYGRFMDSFWGSMDTLRQDSAPVTVREVLHMIENSYEVAMRDHGSEIQGFGVQPMLGFDRGVGSEKIWLDLKDIKKQSVDENLSVLEIFSPGESVQDDIPYGGINIDVIFDGSKRGLGYGGSDVGKVMGVGLNIDLDGPVDQLFGNTEMLLNYSKDWSGRQSAGFNFIDDASSFATYAEIVSKYPDWAGGVPPWSSMSLEEFIERRNDSTFVSVAQFACNEIK